MNKAHHLLNNCVRYAGDFYRHSERMLKSVHFAVNGPFVEMLSTKILIRMRWQIFSERILARITRLSIVCRICKSAFSEISIISSNSFVYSTNANGVRRLNNATFSLKISMCIYKIDMPLLFINSTRRITRTSTTKSNECILPNSTRFILSPRNKLFKIESQAEYASKTFGSNVQLLNISVLTE
ncbi:hypothetical protein T4B_11097 [Trichinella pseudospiralis]|uniref:Uncharacterized protein n=1 Tax=Trichinella pseudospiralis TaxID=6337 RepID=A0A0V1IBB6_TRIPS|nr:hypothetical protein T4B_11097 [Trichinella pseudospiralis]